MPESVPAGPPIDPALFQGLSPQNPHLCCGSEAPLLKTMADALQTYAEARSQGSKGRRRLEAAKDDAKRRLAAFLGEPGGTETIAFTPGTAPALDVVARAIDWKAGDEIVLPAREYPSVTLAWRALPERGVTVRRIDGGTDPESALLDAVTARTRLVCVSHVDWRTGRRLDLERLGAGLRPRGILLAADVAHSVGVLPVPVRACDILVGCTHKFLLGMHGVGFLFWRDPPAAAQGRTTLGWYALQSLDRFVAGGDAALKPGAAAFEPSNPAFIAILGLARGLDCLEAAGPGRIAAHAAALAAETHAALSRRGIPCLTPAEPERRGTSLAIPDPWGETLFRHLDAAGIRCAHGVGRLRLSFHGYNTLRDLERLTDVLANAPIGA